MQSVDGHEGDLSGEAQSVHFGEDHGASAIRIDDVME